MKFYAEIKFQGKSLGYVDYSKKAGWHCEKNHFSFFEKEVLAVATGWEVVHKILKKNRNLIEFKIDDFEIEVNRQWIVFDN